jgi:hypothetical protein
VAEKVVSKEGANRVTVAENAVAEMQWQRKVPTEKSSGRESSGRERCG